MSSWTNKNATSLKKKEPVRNFFSSDEDYATSTLKFLYTYVYLQRNADPFFVYDANGYFEPLLKANPVIHYVKQAEQGTNYANDIKSFEPVFKSMSLPTFKRTIDSIYKYNPFTQSKIENIVTTSGLRKQVYDAGIVLDISGCVPVVINGLKQLQKKTGKKTMSIFVMTNDLNLLREFAMKGDPSWNFTSLMRNNAPQDKDYLLFKTLAELQIMREIEYLALRFSAPLGKLLYLTSSKVTMENQVIRLDNSSWKLLE
jgi:hypothetical protein